MQQRILIAVVFPLFSLCSCPIHAVEFDWATVGNPGNSPDEPTEFNNPNLIRFGSVDYVYRISTHEVTNTQYSTFLNAVDPTGANSLGLYNTKMSTTAVGGINLNTNADNGSKYESKEGRGNNPVVFVSLADSMRFINWLENGQQDHDTESGVYTMGSGIQDRLASARFWIPSEDEWYKAAYYHPSGHYFDYATGTDTEPYSDNPSSLDAPDVTNVANFFRNDSLVDGYDDGFAVTGLPNRDDSQNFLTDVGSYSFATSPYGTFDQSGNVWEWTEGNTSAFSIARGGSYGNFFLSTSDVGADIRSIQSPGNELGMIGFRVASLLSEASPLCNPNTAGDVDGNNQVEFADFLIMSRNFGRDLASHTEGDINCDGTVSFADFLILSTTFGIEVDEIQSVPEPSGSVFLAGAFLLGIRNRHCGK